MQERTKLEPIVVDGQRRVNVHRTEVENIMSQLVQQIVNL